MGEPTPAKAPLTAADSSKTEELPDSTRNPEDPLPTAEKVKSKDTDERKRASRGSASSKGTGKGSHRTPQFAPRDIKDGREELEWESSYKEWGAKWGIRFEASYLGMLFVLIPVSLFLVWQRSPGGHFAGANTRAEFSQTISNYILAWIGGTLGGTLFSTKWLYHSVAKKIWHVDRRLWRLFTPHLSGALAFATYVMVTSGLLPIVEKKALETEGMAFSLGFIVGYFSDSATAKLTEVAETLFGSNRK